MDLFFARKTLVYKPNYSEKLFFFCVIYLARNQVYRNYFFD